MKRTFSFLPAIFLLSAFSLPGEIPGTTFEFLRSGSLHSVPVTRYPAALTKDGITLRAHAAFGPVDFANFLNPALEPAISVSETDNIGLGVDSPGATNAGFEAEFGNDLQNESIVFNFLQSVTISFDHSVVLTELAFTDLEQHERFIFETEDGVRAEIHGTTPWSVGNSGLSVWAGAALGDLEDHLIERGTRITITFDAINPADRIADGTGNNLSASPSSAVRWIKVAPPQTFSMGTPYVVQGGVAEATVAVELWGEAAAVTLYWTNDMESGWTNQTSLGNRSPIKIEDALITGLSPNTVWHYRFGADNGTEVVYSPVATFAWATDLYVSPEGDDAFDGLTPGTALQTIEEALRRIRGMARRPQPEGPLVPNFYFSAESPHGADLQDHLNNLVDPVNVNLLPGYHHLTRTIVIDKETDGNIHFRGVWAEGAEAELQARLEAHGNDPRWMDPPATHLPVVSGGVPLGGWSPTTVNGVAAWVTEIPEVADGTWNFHQLFVNGRRAERSRWPKEGWFRPEEGNNSTRLDFRMFERDVRDISPADMRNLNDVQVVLLHRWVETRIRVGSYDTDTRWVNLLPPAPNPLFDFNASHPAHGAGLTPYYMDNVFETMSEPGEWYLDRSDGHLYYIPLPGETMESAHVVAPRLLELFRINGREAGPAGATQINQRLWHVTFHRLAFLHTRVGELALHTSTGNIPYNSGNGALFYRFARAPRVEACLFGHLGEWGVDFGPETAGGVISSNLFRSMAFGGIKVWQSNQTTDLQQRTGWNRINDNDLLGWGLYWHGGVALMALESVFSDIDHNHVREGTYNAIVVGGVNTLTRYGFANRIRHNLIHDYGQGVLSDLAGIYSPGKSPHTFIEGNVVFNSDARDYQSQTVYLDGQAEYWTVRNNWLSGTNVGSLAIKGWTNDVYNNVLAFNTGEGMIDRANSEVSSSSSPAFPLIPRRAPKVERNIFYQAGVGFIYRRSTYTDAFQPWANLDANLYWNQTARLRMDPQGRSLDQFKAAENTDLTAIEADPLLFNPQRRDFRVPAHSPAVTQQGFVPFDNRGAGVREAVWLAAGAVPYTVPEAPLPAWMPSDVPGLDAWLDAADFSEDGPIHEWRSKTPFSYRMRQFDTDLQPLVQTNARNGRPVVHFGGSAWMGNHEHSWRARRFAGQFRDDEFTIFTVHRAEPGNHVVLAKGDTGNTGQWTIGEQGNALRWNGTENIGIAGDEFAVRAWRRTASAWEYYENGELRQTSTALLAHDFSSEGIFYLGRRGGGTGDRFVGEVAEVLVYMGRVEEADVDQINQYLLTKWLPGEPGEAEIFTDSEISENRAAYGSAYLRTLTLHVDPAVDSSALVFSKVSGPDWLTVSTDGTLGGMPPVEAVGLNTFEVRAENSLGEVHAVTLQIQVAAPNPQPSSVPQSITVEADAGMVHLHWPPSPDPDFSHYVILRSDTLENFAPIAQPVWQPFFTDVLPSGGRWFYLIQPVNSSGN